MDPKNILYEDNHVIVINKLPSEIVQGDKTGDKTMPDGIKEYLKEKYNKPGNVFCGVVHRLDRPTSGAVIFAKTSKGLERLNAQFRDKDTHKVYWAIVENLPKETAGELVHFLKKNEKQNKSYVCTPKTLGGKEAKLSYRLIKSSDNYHLLEVHLETGRHHQIRAQLSTIGCTIKGDLKYGFDRSNQTPFIHLHSYKTEFIHPIKQEPISVTCKPRTDDTVWNELTKLV